MEETLSVLFLVKSVFLDMGLAFCPKVSVECDKYKTPRDKVMGLFDFLLQFMKQSAFKGCNFLNVAAELPVGHPAVRALIKKQKNQTRSLFAGIMKPVGKEELGDELYLLFDAALVSSKVYEDGWPIKTARKMAGKLI